MTQWYYSKDGEKQGPITPQQLKQLVASGDLQPFDLIWKDGMDEWKPAKSLKGLFQVQATSQQGPPPVTANEPTIVDPSLLKKSVTKFNSLKTPQKILVGVAAGMSMFFFLCIGLVGIGGLAGGIDGVNNENRSRRGSSNSNSGDAIPDDAAISVMAEQLMRDYDANEIAADEKYKGKTLDITGTIEDIKKDILDNSYVTLKSGKQLDFRSVQCYFIDDSALITLLPGRRVKIRGRCDGLFGNVNLKDCVLVVD